MKFLDEKGRLFGKVNLIDLLVVVMVLIIVLAVAWKLGGNQINQAMESTKELPTMEYEVICYGVNNDVCEYAETRIGDQLMSNGEMLDGYITDVSVEPYYIVCIDSEGNAVNAQDPQNSNIRFTIQTQVEETENAYAVGSQEIRVGKSHIVKSVNIEVTGYITRMEEVTTNE